MEKRFYCPECQSEIKEEDAFETQEGWGHWNPNGFSDPENETATHGPLEQIEGDK